MAEHLDSHEYDVLVRALEALAAGGAIVKPGDLIGPGEAATIIGVDRTTVSRWIKAGYTPAPLQTIMVRGGRGVPVWTRATIVEFAEQHRSRADAVGRRPLGTAR